MAFSLKEDLRATVYNENGSFALVCFPGDPKTKEWVENRKSHINDISPSELLWSSYGILEFMEDSNGLIWIEKPRRKQIIFNLSMLTDEYLDVLKINIEKKYHIQISRGQIQPVRISGLNASITIISYGIKRIFYGTIRNMDSLRPLQVVFEFNNDYDMQLVIDELKSNDGIVMTCNLIFGNLQIDKSCITILKQKLTDSKIGELAFGSNSNLDYAYFTPSQLDELSQRIVNNIVVSELTSAGGFLSDMHPLVMGVLQPEPVDVILTESIISQLSTINNEGKVLLEKINLSISEKEDIFRSLNENMSKPPLSPDHLTAADSKEPSHHSHSAKSIHSHKLDGYDSDSKLHHVSSNHSTSKYSRLYKVLRIRATENIMLQWPRIVIASTTPPNSLHQVDIESRKNICRYVEPAVLWAENPSPPTNISVLRLPRSAWVNFTPPMSCGASPIEYYTIRAKPIGNIDKSFDDDTSAKGTHSHSSEGDTFHRQNSSLAAALESKVIVSGQYPPILVDNLHPDLEYTFRVEAHNITSSSRSQDVIAFRDCEMFATIPLYGIIMYSGPREAIPHNYRVLDGTEPGVPNLNACFTMKTDVSSAAIFSTANSTSSDSAAAPKSTTPKWQGLLYIQRIY